MFVTLAQAQEAAGEAIGHGAEGESTFPPFDPTYYPSQILWLAITFGLFYLILKSVILPRIAGTLETRRDRIAQDLDQAARMREEANEATAAYEQELAEARRKAQRLSNEAQDEARAKADEERKRVEAELEQQIEDAEAEIETMRSEAMANVDDIAAETASAMVAAILGSSDDAKVRSAVDNVRKEEAA